MYKYCFEFKEIQIENQSQSNKFRAAICENVWPLIVIIGIKTCESLPI